MAAFFNFNIDDEGIINRQVEILSHKYEKHRKSNLSQIEKERTIRGYVLEALIAYQFKKGETIANHPAANVLYRMIGWLDAFGYSIKFSPNQDVVAIVSSRNTYVAKPIQDPKEMPTCCMSLMDNIKYTIKTGDTLD